MSIGVISLLHTKAIKQAKIEKDIQTFLQAGGKIKYIPPYISGQDVQHLQARKNGAITRTS